MNGLLELPTQPQTQLRNVSALPGKQQVLSARLLGGRGEQMARQVSGQGDGQILNEPHRRPSGLLSRS